MMKTEITAFDLHFLTQELQQLVNERLDKTYVLADRGILLTFSNKTFLQTSPGKLWTPSSKPETPEKIHSFAAQLRKLIGNSKVLKIEQVCSERILAIHANRSEKTFVLYLEVFGRGNAVLCDANNIVITALALNNRVERGKAYKLPESLDTFHISEQDFALRFSQSTDNVSKTLAVQFGLGRALADELCVRSGVSPTEKATPEHAKDIYPILRVMLAQKLQPQLVFEDSRIIDATPIPFQCYANNKRENISGFGQALDRIFSLPAEAVTTQKLAPMKAKLEKVEKMIAMQQKNLLEMQKKAEEEYKKGEWIYEHYQEVKQFLDEIMEARKTLSWKEIKEKIKKIKELNEATGELTVVF